jgi:hypothetical protein
MNESERSGLSKMRDCWITGGAAADLAPAEWKELLGNAPAADRERLLLAIAGQALDVAFRPAAPKILTRRAPLPQLALPPLPERLRPLFRTALKQASDASGRMWVAALAAARGYVAHPLDWMPAASDLDAPPVYAPWVDWQARGGKAARVLEELSAENWDDFFPAARRIALAGIRRSDPAKARALLEARAGAEAAETRLALIELLRVNLGAADAPYLQSLSADRSGKVKQLAARLLARIGQTGTGSEASADVAELAGFIEQGRSGLLRRRTVYTPHAAKSPAQAARRRELFEACQLIDLAGALGAGEAELVEGWQLGSKDGADSEFAGMVAASGSDAAVVQLADRLIAAGDAVSLAPLLPRLDTGRKRGFVAAVLGSGPAALSLLNASDIEPGTFGRKELMDSRLYRHARTAIAESGKSGQRIAIGNLDALAYLATVSAAEAIAADLVEAGLASADSPLALLRLNAALADPNN